MLGNDVWKFFKGCLDAVGEFLQGRNFPFEGGGGVFYVRFVNLKEGCGIGWCGNS